MRADLIDFRQKKKEKEKPITDEAELAFAKEEGTRHPQSNMKSTTQDSTFTTAAWIYPDGAVNASASRD